MEANDATKLADKINKIIQYYDNKKPEEIISSILDNFNIIKKDIDKIYKPDAVTFVRLNS